MDRFSGRPKGGEIAAGIDQAAGLIALAKAIDRAIDSEPFGYASQIDFHSRMMEANMILREQRDGIARCRPGRLASEMRTVAWQKPQSLQRRRYRNIEYAARGVMQGQRSLQHSIGPGIDGDVALARLAIEPANIAVRIVETHQAMNFVDDREGRVNRTFRRRRRCTGAADFDERAEKGPCAANAIGCVHTLPESA